MPGKIAEFAGARNELRCPSPQRGAGYRAVPQTLYRRLLRLSKRGIAVGSTYRQCSISHPDCSIAEHAGRQLGGIARPKDAVVSEAVGITTVFIPKYFDLGAISADVAEVTQAKHLRRNDPEAG